MVIEFHKPPFVLKSIKIEVTYECPLTCIHCSSDAGPSSSLRMSRETAVGLCRQVIEMGVKEIDFSGGEPLGWPWISEVVGICARGGLQTTLYTSGFVRDFKSRVRDLRESGLERVIFSIFGDDEQSHERVTRKSGSFRGTIDAVRSAKALELQPEFHFVPFRNNFDRLPGIIELSESLGVEQVSVLRFVPQGRGTLLSDLVLSKSENEALRSLIRQGRKKLKIRAGSPYNFLLVNESPKCCAAIDRMIVVPDCQIHPCDAFKGMGAQLLVGTDEYSRLDKWSLQECWERSPYLGAVRQYLTTDFPEKCATCRLLSQCLSGCLAQKVLVNGDFRKDIDPMCLTAG